MAVIGTFDVWAYIIINELNEDLNYRMNEYGYVKHRIKIFGKRYGAIFHFYFKECTMKGEIFNNGK